MGFSTAFTEFPIGHSFHYTGIRFFPMAFPQVIGLNASELTNRFEYLGSGSSRDSRPVVITHLTERLSKYASPE